MDVVLVQLSLVLCLVMLGTTLLEGVLVLGHVARGARLLLLACAVTACVVLVIPVVRAIPRGARGWALRFGSRIGGRVVLVIGVPVLTGLATVLALADRQLPESAADGLSSLLRVLMWLGVSLVWGLARARRRPPGAK